MAHDNAPTLDDVLASALARRESQGILRRLTTRARNVVDFSSNDYLSLSQNPDIRRTYLSCLGAPGANGNAVFALGSGGSRLLDGNSAMAEALERSLAGFHGAPAGLLFNSGFEANTGLFACVPQAGDVVIFDDLVHASVHSGIKLSRASQRLPFKHNSVWKQEGAQLAAQNPIPDALGGTMSLDVVLHGLVEGEGGRELREGRKHVFIAVEAIYSMDGDLAPLEDIVRCVENRLPMRNGHVIVDEAHSNGLLGDSGQGLVCHLGLENRVWARVHTFGKALGCSGGMRPVLRPTIYMTKAGRLMSLHSGCALLGCHSRISHQLRTHVHLHDRDGVSRTAQYPSRLSVRLQRTGRRISTQIARSDAAHEDPARRIVFSTQSSSRTGQSQPGISPVPNRSHLHDESTQPG